MADSIVPFETAQRLKECVAQCRLNLDTLSHALKGTTIADISDTPEQLAIIFIHIARAALGAAELLTLTSLDEVNVLLVQSELCPLPDQVRFPLQDQPGTSASKEGS